MEQRLFYNYQRALNFLGQKYFPEGYRLGSLIKIINSDGIFGIGEMAPLSLINSPHIKSYALDMAHNHILLKTKSLSSPKNQQIKLSALAYSFDMVKKYIDMGYSCVKIKISEATNINKINLPKNIKIRLDFNKNFNLIDIIKILRKLDIENIEYIEEPLVNITDIDKLIKETGVNIALDESFMGKNCLEKLARLGVSYIIIKPARFSGFKEIENIVKKARILNIKIIFSTCFESEYFAAYSALILFFLDLLEDHHGIFCPDIYKNNFLFNRPEIALKDIYNWLINFDPADHKWINRA